MFEAILTSASHTVRAHVMCDTIGVSRLLLCLRSLLTRLAGTMRSAILQPKVPPHVFPAKKATENSNTQLGKPISKRTSSNSNSGSKRKALDTGFDEFDDVGINDADLALAEKGGFESIDNFDDDARPNYSVPRKKQRSANAHNDETTTNEPRQLANGKWACNHNCKDKTSCKHLCCREGLDKKPKPPKSRASKKEPENSADPKQTQLSLSVTKGAKTSATTQPSQQQRAVPAPDRNPPRGPEMHNLNTLHNKTKSSTQSVSLLSATGSRARKPSPPIVLPRPGQPRSKTTEAARRAAQNVYSDDFGDIDDISLFDDHTTHGPSTHSGPPLEKESDQFGDGIEDMLDIFSPADKDDFHSRAPATAEDDHTKSSSLYGFDEDILLPLEQALNNTHQSDLSTTHKGAAKSAGPFFEISDDSAILDLGCQTKGQGSSSATAKKSIDYTPAMYEDHGHSHVHVSNGEATEERPASSDSATKVFMEELGTDLFNYTG